MKPGIDLASLQARQKARAVNKVIRRPSKIELGKKAPRSVNKLT